MDIDTFKFRIAAADEISVDELCIKWLHDFSLKCDKTHIALLLEMVADQLGIDMPK